MYRPTEPGAAPAQVEVVAEDLDRLGEEEFLNDTLIDFYLKCAVQPLCVGGSGFTLQLPKKWGRRAGSTLWHAAKNTGTSLLCGR